MKTKARKPRLTAKTMAALRTASHYINADAEAMDGDDTQTDTRQKLFIAAAWIDQLDRWYRSKHRPHPSPGPRAG